MKTQTKMSEMIQTILNKLVADYAPERVVLFGSQINGEPDWDSDIDLLIIKETSDRFLDRWVEVQKILTGTHPSTPVDTLILTPAEIKQRLAKGDQFIAEILTSGKLLYTIV